MDTIKDIHNPLISICSVKSLIKVTRVYISRWNGQTDHH